MNEATSWLRALDTAPPPWDGVVPVHPDVREMMHADFRTYLPDDPLVKIDQGSMAVALEYRSPMLDPDVIRQAFGWPTEGLFDRAGGRVPIRRLLGQLNMPIPPAKRGFAVPLYRWLRGPLRGWAEDLLLHDPGDPIDQALVESLWRKLSGGRRDAATGVWTILCWRAWNRTRFA
jgi:asparagine synthase (glutamine-hydrolysing)